MGRWTYVSNNDDLELPDARHNRPDTFSVSPTIEAKLAAVDGGEKRLIPVVRAADPVFDPATHIIDGQSESIGQTEITVTRTVRALTQDELDDKATNAQLQSWIPTFEANNATAAQTQTAMAEVLKRLVQ